MARAASTQFLSVLRPREGAKMQPVSSPYAVRFDVEYPDRTLNRLTTAFRLCRHPDPYRAGHREWSLDRCGTNQGGVALAGGLLAIGPLLMILFRQKYPRWWFDWNVALLRFLNRIGAYLLLLRDEYPSTDDEQNVNLELDYPNVPTQLNRWLPLVKWLLGIPHFIVLIFLSLAAIVVAIVAWFAILFTGRY